MLEQTQMVGYITDKWTLRQQLVNATVNSDCRLEWVGREVLQWHGAYASKHDSSELCTSTLNYILSIIVEDMVLDGFVDQVLTRAVAQRATKMCSNVIAEDDEDSLSLATVNMGGAFLLHGVVCLVCVAGAAITHHIKQRRKKAKKHAKQHRFKEDSSSSDSDNEREDRRLRYIVQQVLQQQQEDLQRMVDNTVRARLASSTPPSSTMWARRRTGPAPSLLPSENAIDPHVVC
mmetsp:Transcript_9710/g.20741  ORF Transcript_9710/g.20741 Transcript_9710/m.20741 type:complete len:233 (-) Transcript_9710:121-819(-)